MFHEGLAGIYLDLLERRRERLAREGAAALSKRQSLNQTAEQEVKTAGALRRERKAKRPVVNRSLYSGGNRDTISLRVEWTRGRRLVFNSRQTIVWVVWMLMLTVAACQALPQPPATAPVQVTLASPATPTAESLAFPTVTPLVTSTLAPTPGGSPTVTATVRAPGGSLTATAAPSGPVAKLQFTLDDLRYSLSPRRRPDSKVQMTITLYPRGGLAPYSFILDSGPQIQGLTYTFDWHNCGETEPHSIVVMSADGQQSRPVGFMFPYDC